MAKEITKKQVFEIVRQMSTGEIDGDRAQQIIENRTPAETKMIADLRERQARRLWDCRIGDALGCETFDQYLNGKGDSLEPIPTVPVFPKEQVRLFGTQLITLVDDRILNTIGLVEYTKLIGLVYDGRDDTFEPYATTEALSGVRWMIAQDGYRNRNRSPNACRKTFASFETGADVPKGIGVWLQDPDVIVDHFMDLPGSVDRDDREIVACLGIWSDGRPELDWHWSDDENANPRYGSVSRGK